MEIELLLKKTAISVSIGWSGKVEYLYMEYLHLAVRIIWTGLHIKIFGFPVKQRPLFETLIRSRFIKSLV